MEPRALILQIEGTLLEIKPIYLVVYRLRQGERTKEYTNENILINHQEPRNLNKMRIG